MLDFSVPTWNKLVVQNINLMLTTYDPACTFFVYGMDDGIPFSLSLNKGAVTPVSQTWWGGQNQVLFTTQSSTELRFLSSGCTDGSAHALLSGYLVPIQ